MTPKIIVTSGVPKKGYMEPEEPKKKDFLVCYDDTPSKPFLDPKAYGAAITKYKAAKDAAIAEAKEFEDEGRTIIDLLPDEAFSDDGFVKDGTYDSPVGWVEVRQIRYGKYLDDPATEWQDSGTSIILRDPAKSRFEYRTILRLVEKEENGAHSFTEGMDLGAGQEKQSGLTENEILKSPLSESQKKWVLTKPLFMIQGKRDDQLTDYELKEKRAWLEINQAQKSQENQPDETQEELWDDLESYIDWQYREIKKEAKDKYTIKRK